MAALLARRGPDDEGMWRDPAGHLTLGFRRLAVMDPSPAGRQPMVAGSGRSVLVFNGELYNFRELGRELESRGVAFRSRSDAEVVLEALDHWGADAVARFNGMFALAWYATRERRLLLARDHAGVKPLYGYLDPGGRGLAFASQYNALFHAPWGPPDEVRPEVLRLYLHLHHIPPPFGLHRHTFQVEPGQVVEATPAGEVSKRYWWRMPAAPRPELAGAEAARFLSGTLADAVARQLVADVPVGVFLSGGVDSPLVAALARRQVGGELEAFTVGSSGWWQDEAEDARRYVALLGGIRHHVADTVQEDVMTCLEDVRAAQHEPFADFSILPTLMVSSWARRRVTVALSGDGGDELFFGYERPLSLLRNGSDFRWPLAIRKALYGLGKLGLARPRSGAVVARDPGEYYLMVNSRLRPAEVQRLAPGLPWLPEEFDVYRWPQEEPTFQSLANFSRYAEFHGQLQRGLKKVDMASMHHSLEVRVPLLDREVVELALRIDPMTCLAGGQRKAILRELLAAQVGPEAIPTVKRGFSVPLGEWLKGPLRTAVEGALFDGPLYPDGAFDRQALWSYWQEHRSGQRSHKWGLWTVLSLQWWATKVRGERDANFHPLHHS